MESVIMQINGTKHEGVEFEIEEYVPDENIEENSESATSIDKTNCSTRKISTSTITRKTNLQYHDSWEKTFVWVQKRNNRAFCTVCDKSLQNHSGHLKRHDNRKSHQTNLKNKRSQLDFLRKKWKRFKENHQVELETHYNDLKTYPVAMDTLSKNVDDTDDIEQQNEQSIDPDFVEPKKNIKKENIFSTERTTRRRGRPAHKTHPVAMITLTENLDDTDEIEQQEEISFQQNSSVPKNNIKNENISSTESPSTRTGRAKRKIDSEGSQFIELERLKLEMLKAEELKFDENYNFLISFLPYMKMMSQTQNLRFRVEMSKLLLRTIEGTDPIGSDNV